MNYLFILLVLVGPVVGWYLTNAFLDWVEGGHSVEVNGH